MASSTPRALLAQTYPAQESVLARALGAHRVTVETIPPFAHLESELTRAARAQSGPLLVVVDLAVLAQLSSALPAVCAWLGRQCPGARLVATCGGQIEVQAQERAWARRCGAVDLVPGVSERDPARLQAVATTLLAALGCPVPRREALAKALATPSPKRLPPSPADEACARHARLEALGTGAAELAAAMRDASGIEIAERPYHLARYPECFVGAEAVDWMAREYGFTRERAVEAGGLLLELGYIYHVAREQPFADGHYFYRFAARLDDLDLATLLKKLQGPGGLEIRDRTHHGIAYPACFVGSETVAWLGARAGLSENRAMTLGQRLIELSIIHHVVDEHPFKNGNFFYRFYTAEPQP